MRLHLRERTVPFTSVPHSHLQVLTGADLGREFSLSGCLLVDGIEISKEGCATSERRVTRLLFQRVLLRPPHSTTVDRHERSASSSTSSLYKQSFVRQKLHAVETE